MDDSERRKLLRRAEDAIDDPEARRELEADGVTFGEWETLDKEALLAELEDDESEHDPSIEVTVFCDESPDRDAIEDRLSEYVESSGIGRWIGSGHGSMNDRQFFDIAFEVSDLGAAIPLIRAKLKELGVGPSTEISASDGTEHNI